MDIVPTGVKHLHREAKKYDIGVYFESNGHGTVLANFDNLNQLKKGLIDPTHIEAMNKLIGYLKLANFTIGDAIADVLLVEAALYLNDMKIEDWDALYEDVPCIQDKVPVKDRSKFKSGKTEDLLISPISVQTYINSLVKSGERAFVRASGTESIVRIYCEASTYERAKEITALIKANIQELKD